VLNAHVKAKIEKLIAAGIIQTGWIDSQLLTTELFLIERQLGAANPNEP